MRAVLLALLVATLLAAPSSAGNVFTRGIGARRCSAFLHDTALHPTTADLGYVTWAEGFVSGMNATSAASGAGYHDLGAIAGDIKRDLRHYCRLHHRSQFTDAVVAIYLKQPHRHYAPK